jgi:hypothetical protein
MSAAYRNASRAQAITAPQQMMRMPASMPADCGMAMMAAATFATGLLLLQIGALTPISLFVRVLIASTLLLLGLVLLISLTLTGLVSLTGLSLVELTTGLTPGTPRGE